MKRFDCMKLLAAKLKDELVVLSLGGSVDEWYTANLNFFTTEFRYLTAIISDMRGKTVSLI